MKTYLLTGKFVQGFTVVVHSDGDDDDITEDGYEAFDKGQWSPTQIEDVEITDIEQIEGDTDPEEI